MEYFLLHLIIKLQIKRNCNDLKLESQNGEQQFTCNLLAWQQIYFNKAENFFAAYGAIRSIKGKNQIAARIKTIGLIN